MLCSNYKTGQNHIIGWCVGTTDPKSNYQIQNPGIKVEWLKKNILHKT